MNHRRRGLISKMMSYAPEYRGTQTTVILGKPYTYDDERVQAVLNGLIANENRATVKNFIEHILDGKDVGDINDFVQEVLGKLKPPNTYTDDTDL